MTAEAITENILGSSNDEMSEAGFGTGGSGTKKLMIIVPIIVLALGLQAVAAYFTVNWLFFSKPLEQKTVKSMSGPGAADSAEVLPESEYGKGEMFLFEDIIVNPAGTMGRRYLVLSLSFEVVGKKGMEELREREPIIRDALFTLLASKSLDYVSDVANLEPLREQIRKTVNAYLDKGDVVRVYFTGYILQ